MPSNGGNGASLGGSTRLGWRKYTIWIAKAQAIVIAAVLSNVR